MCLETHLHLCECSALTSLLQQVPADVKNAAQRLAFDGTSATVLLVDRGSGEVIADAKLYNEAQPEACVAAAKVCDRLCKLMARMCF